jgi:hypothetical protein
MGIEVHGDGTAMARGLWPGGDASLLPTASPPAGSRRCVRAWRSSRWPPSRQGGMRARRAEGGEVELDEPPTPSKAIFLPHEHILAQLRLLGTHPARDSALAGRRLGYSRQEGPPDPHRRLLVTMESGTAPTTVDSAVGRGQGSMWPREEAGAVVAGLPASPPSPVLTALPPPPSLSSFGRGHPLPASSGPGGPHIDRIPGGPAWRAAVLELAVGQARERPLRSAPRPATVG